MTYILCHNLFNTLFDNLDILMDFPQGLILQMFSFKQKYIFIYLFVCSSSFPLPFFWFVFICEQYFRDYGLDTFR